MNAPFTPQKPEVIKADFQSIAKNLSPLVAQKRWLAWRFEYTKGGKWTKPPRNPFSGLSLNVGNADSLLSFEEVKAAYEAGGWDGVGYSLDDDTAALDLDKCRNPETGQLDEWMTATAEVAKSYTELTPSGTGARIIGFGTGPVLHRTLPVEDFSDGAQIEFYRKATRYITVTGVQPEGFDEYELANIDGIAERLVEALGGTVYAPATGDAPATAPDLPAPDEDELDMAMMILLRGGMETGHRSETFHQVVTGLRDNSGLAPAQIEALMRRYPNGIAAKYLEAATGLKR
jgi:putative DNA primase/helicase